MKRIISALALLALFNFSVLAHIKYFNNSYADIVIDIQKDKVIFFAFGGSNDGTSADFAINAVLEENKFDDEIIGYMQDLYISDIVDYKVDRLDRKICIKLNNNSMTIDELDCLGICPLLSNFLGEYDEKENMPKYLMDMFSESQIDQNNILFSIKEQITNYQPKLKTIIPSRQYLYDDASENYQTKMYLIKGDKVEVLKEESEWLYVLYKGSKEIRKWIPKSAVE